jgi:SAM-dependent methyltransferase
MRVLDVATGTGAALVEATRRVGRGGLVVGVDLAEPMVSEAQRRVRTSGASNVTVAVMDAEALGFLSRSFDVVVCAFALYLFPRPEVHQPSPDRTLAVWLDSSIDLSCTDSIQGQSVDVDHRPNGSGGWVESCSILGPMEEVAARQRGVMGDPLRRIVGA